MKRTIPLLITAVAGFVLIISFFIPRFQEWGESAAVWFDILASVAFILGGGNLLKLHLQSISDRKAGWGYSGVTLVAFLATLIFGLLKFGSPPEPNVEYYGESFAPLPLAEMPEFSVEGTIPPRPDRQRLPDSVQLAGASEPLLREEEGRLLFRGWMLPRQRDDLLGYQDLLEWRCAIERLADAAQPPEPLRGRVRYYTTHRALSFSGSMTDDERDHLLELFEDSEAGRRAVERLFQAGRRESILVIQPRPEHLRGPRDTAQFVANVERLPENFALPEEAENFVTLEEDRLIFRGPMSVRQRDRLANVWPNFDRDRPLTPEQRQDLLQEIAAQGDPLNEDQREAFEEFLDGSWTAEQLILAVNTAGIAVPTPKTACEFLEEIEAGVIDPDPEHPPGESHALNEDQEAVVEEFVNRPEQTEQELIERLRAAGELAPGLEAEIRQFLARQPTVAEQRRDLAFVLLEHGPLSRQQTDFLLEGAREQFAWRQAVGSLFVAAHQVKHPWSGHYSAQGNPFWWIYAYVFQPLLTTTFAMLAFYVASAAFRAFRAKNLEAILLLGTAFIILLGRTFAGYLLTSWIPDAFSALRIDEMTVYIMAIFNTAGNRAIMIGIALGIASTSLKVLLGVDRSYLGSGD